MNWGIGIDIYTLLTRCIQYITSEKPAVWHRDLYSALCGGLNRKEIQKRGRMCISISDSLCFTAETSPTLQCKYTPIKVNVQRTLLLFFEAINHRTQCPF